MGCASGSACGIIVELDGHEKSVRGELKDLEKIVRRQNPLSLARGLGAAQCEAIWKIRREFSYSLRDTGLTKLNEDIVVPFRSYVELIRYTREVRDRVGLATPTFGHAADGNFHVHIMYDRDNPEHCRKAETAIHEVMTKVVELGGAITGEHGIGLAKKPWWTSAVAPEADALHRTIKQALDPGGILNPGKFLG